MPGFCQFSGAATVPVILVTEASGLESMCHPHEFVQGLIHAMATSKVQVGREHAHAAGVLADVVRASPGSVALNMQFPGVLAHVAMLGPVRGPA